MRISRRTFLGSLVAGPALAHVSRPGARCVVMDLAERCVLPESLAGFREQVGDLRHGDAEILIVPGAGSLAENDINIIQQFLGGGATVLLELCSGPRASQAAYFPYVEYFWPVRVKIREFVPIWLEPAPGDEVIATFAARPVGLRRRVGDGTLVTLGSPLGPVFRTGDPDARLWLKTFLAHAT
jgi:hypothetical protein